MEACNRAMLTTAARRRAVCIGGCAHGDSSVARGNSTYVGALDERGLNEALRLAVGAGRVARGEELTDPELPTGGGEACGAMAGSVVGHHSGHPTPGRRSPRTVRWRKSLTSGLLCPRTSQASRVGAEDLAGGPSEYDVPEAVNRVLAALTIRPSGCAAGVATKRDMTEI